MTVFTPTAEAVDTAPLVTEGDTVTFKSGALVIAGTVTARPLSDYPVTYGDPEGVEEFQVAYWAGGKRRTRWIAARDLTLEG